MCLEAVVDNSTNKRIELVIVLFLACFGVYGCFRIGFAAANARGLRFEARLPLLKGRYLLLRGVGLGFVCCEDVTCLINGFLELLSVGQLIALLRRGLEIAFVLHEVKLVLAFMDDAAFGVAKDFFTVDSTVFDDCSVEFGEDGV